MHAVDQRQRLLLQRLGGGDVGKNHELLDQPVRVETFRHDDAIDGAVWLEQDFALGQVEVERVALVAGALHRVIGGIKRLEDRIEQGTRGVVGLAVDRGLRLRVIEFRRRAHQHAMEGVRVLAAVGGDHEPHRQRAARFARHQRAEIVGDALGQHRHHAVGEIDRVAADQRVAIERGVGAYIERDVGDRDMDDEAALVIRIGIGFRMHRVVMILGVGRIDRDQRHVAPVLAAFQRGGLGRLGFGDRVARKRLRNVMGVDRDLADRLFARDRAEPLLDLAGGKPKAAARARDRR